MALTHPGLEDAVALHAVGQHVPGQPEVAQHIVAALADGGEEATTADKSFVPRRTLRYSSRLSGVQGINALRATQAVDATGRPKIQVFARPFRPRPSNGRSWRPFEKRPV